MQLLFRCHGDDFFADQVLAFSSQHGLGAVMSTSAVLAHGAGGQFMDILPGIES